MDKQKLIDSLKNGLIVSCQTEPHDIIHEENRTVVMFAKAAEWGGAVAIRSNSVEQVRLIREAVKLPIIGLEKRVYDGFGIETATDVIITPTVEDAVALYNAGAEIIAVDCTQRLNPWGKMRYEIIPEIKKAIPDAIILADVDNTESALIAEKYGADMVAPTLFGYTKETANLTPPDYMDVARMCNACKVPVIMEGHVYTPEDAMKSIYLGCHAVVVGSAITRPHLTTKRYVDLLNGLKSDWRDAEKSWTGDKSELNK